MRHVDMAVISGRDERNTRCLVAQEWLATYVSRLTESREALLDMIKLLDLGGIGMLQGLGLIMKTKRYHERQNIRPFTESKSFTNGQFHYDRFRKRKIINIKYDLMYRVNQYE